jgi:Ca2+-binding RTX toxin-like protein
MAKVVYHTAVDFSGINISIWLNATVVSLTPTEVILESEEYSTTVSGTGLGFKPGKGYTGVVTDFTTFQSGDARFTVSELNVSLARVMASSSDPAELLKVLFNGKDQVIGSQFNDVLMGFGGKDALDGGDEADTLIGGAGDDNLNGGTGNDSLDGGLGYDFFDSGTGNDTVNGGAFINIADISDTASYQNSTTAVNVNLGLGFSFGNGTANKGSNGTDTLININVVRGSELADTITGSAGQVFEQFEGEGGNDTIDGGAIDLRGADVAGGVHGDGFNAVDRDNVTGGRANRGQVDHGRISRFS